MRLVVKRAFHSSDGRQPEHRAEETAPLPLEQRCEYVFKAGPPVEKTDILKRPCDPVSYDGIRTAAPDLISMENGSFPKSVCTIL